MMFFRTHSDFHTVYRISELLISPHHNNIQDDEWQHIRNLLHSLKRDDFLIVKNEGGNIHEEKFGSTPDRVQRYFEKHCFNDVDNLQTKTDDELKEIMRARIENQHLPHSIYHRAKQELEFRRQSGIINNGIIAGGPVVVGRNIVSGNLNSDDYKPTKTDIVPAKSTLSTDTDSLFPHSAPPIIAQVIWVWRVVDYLVGRLFNNFFVRRIVVIALFLLVVGIVSMYFLRNTDRFTYQPHQFVFSSESEQQPGKIHAIFQGDIRNISSEPRYLRNFVGIIWKNESRGETWSYAYSTDVGEVYSVQGASTTPITLPLRFEPNETKTLQWRFTQDFSDDPDILSFLSQKTCEGVFCWTKNGFDVLMADSRGNIFDRNGILESQKVIDTWWVYPNNRATTDRIIASMDLVWQIVVWKIKAFVSLPK